MYRRLFHLETLAIVLAGSALQGGCKASEGRQIGQMVSEVKRHPTEQEPTMEPPRPVEARISSRLECVEDGDSYSYPDLITGVDAVDQDWDHTLSDLVHAEGFGTFPLRSYVQSLARIESHCTRLIENMRRKERELHALGINARESWKIEIVLAHQGSIGRTVAAAQEIARTVDGDVVELYMEVDERNNIERCIYPGWEDEFGFWGPYTCISPPISSTETVTAPVQPTDLPELRLAYAASVLAGVCPGAVVRILLNGPPPDRVRRKELTIPVMDAAVASIIGRRDSRVFLVYPAYHGILSGYGVSDLGLVFYTGFFSNRTPLVEYTWKYSTEWVLPSLRRVARAGGAQGASERLHE